MARAGLSCARFVWIDVDIAHPLYHAKAIIWSSESGEPALLGKSDL
jgi:hypothetical protein